MCIKGPGSGSHGEHKGSELFEDGLIPRASTSQELYGSHKVEKYGVLMVGKPKPGDAVRAVLKCLHRTLEVVKRQTLEELEVYRDRELTWMSAHTNMC